MITKRLHLNTASMVLLKFAALGFIVMLATVGTHLIAAEVTARSVPESVMGPGYNAPPPHIPVS